MQRPCGQWQLESRAHCKAGIQTMAHDQPCAGIEQTKAQPTARTMFQIGKGTSVRARR
jgi:hypothetical protein